MRDKECTDNGNDAIKEKTERKRKTRRELRRQRKGGLTECF